MSGYHLYQASRLEFFPRTYPDLFLQDHPLSDPVYIVVQNAGLGEWLNRYLARQRGAVMGSRILMPEQALRFFAGGYPAARELLGRESMAADPAEASKGRRGLLFMDGMKVTVFKALEEAIAGDDPVFAPIRDYAAGGGARLWQLADALAGIFYHYGMNCLPLVEVWDSGRSYPGLGPRDAAAEDWQRELWRQIFHAGAPYTHLSRVLSEAMDSKEAFDGPSSRVVLFGSMFLGETGLRFFRHLARRLDVHHFLLCPSRTFAGMPTAENPSAPGSAAPVPSEPVQGDLFADVSASAGASDSPASAGGGNPAHPRLTFLRENGRLSAGFAALVPSLEPDDFFVSPELEQTAAEVSREENRSTLERLRLALLRDEPMDGEAADDGSLAIHDVSGIRREVEVCRDRILAALRDDPTLAPTDIGVLAPDIARYAPYIETVFPSIDEDGRQRPGHLPFNLTDLPARTESPYSAGFRSLMALPGSRFGRKTMGDLFANPCFAPAAGDPDAAAEWPRLADRLHVRWGTDRNHRIEEGAADPLTGSWESAFQRLLAGYYHEEGDDPSILPEVLDGEGAFESAGRLMHVLRTLGERIRGLDKKRLGLREWILLWESETESWLTARSGDGSDEDDADRLRIKGAFRDLTALCDDLDDLSDFSDAGLPWSAFSSLLEETANPSGRRRGRYLARGVTCASLKPMRAIPFRRIYVLGLDEGTWPGLDMLTGFDLREHVPGFIDLSRESVDRFALLETLLSASDHLSLSYTGRDAERGEVLAPAAPLIELCDLLGPGWTRLRRRHPLAPWDSAALTGGGPLATSSTKAASLAESRRRGPSASVSGGPLPPESEETAVEWTELLAFLKNPVRYFFRSRLGTAPETPEADTGEDDLLETESLGWWQWRNAALEADPSLAGGPAVLAEGYRQRLVLENAVTDSPLAGLEDEVRRDDAAALAAQLERLASEGLDTVAPFACLLDPRCGGSAQDDPVPDRGADLRLPAPRLSPAGVPPLTIVGRIGGFRMLRGEDGPDPKTWTLLDFVSSRTVRSGHNLRGWLAALLIGAAMGDERPREIRVFRAGGRDHKARRYYFRDSDVPGTAGGEKRVLENPAAVLGRLVKAFRDGESVPLALYPEMADALAKAGKKIPLDECLETEAEKTWNKIIADSWAPSSALRDCSWRRRFLNEPDFSGGAFRRAWEGLYRDGGIL